MSFLFPLGLLALLSLPIILLLHLMRERRRRVTVPSLLLWQLMPRRQEAERRRRLPLTLLLLFHLLVAALLALALAQPQWIARLFGGERHLAVIIDTSTSMQAPSGDFEASRLDAARDRARSLIGGLGAQDTLSLIVAGSEAQVLDTAGSAGASRLFAALDTLVASGTGSSMGEALVLAEATLQDLPAAEIVVLSDAAMPALETELARYQPAVPLNWEIIGGSLPNRAVLTLSARTRSANAPIQVYSRLVNYADRAFAGVARLYGDNTLLDTSPLNFQAGAEIELTWAVPAGVQMLRVELDGEDDLPIDNMATLSLTQNRTLRTLVVSANSAALERALRAMPDMNVVVLAPSDYNEAAPPLADLTVFDGFLPSAWPAGAVLAIDPPTGTTDDLLQVSGRTSTAESGSEGDGLRATTNLFDGVSLANVDFGAVPTITVPEWAEVQLAQGSQPLILRGQLGQSEIAVWAFNLSQSNLTSRLAFPLLMARTVRDLAASSLPTSALLGQPLSWRADPRVDSLELVAPDGTAELMSVQPHEAVVLRPDQAGLYTVRELVAGEPFYVAQLPVNAGASIESDLVPRTIPAQVTRPVAAASVGTEGEIFPIWPILAILALIGMFVEWFYVHARRRAVS